LATRSLKSGEADTADGKIENEEAEVVFENGLKVGDVVTFGSFEQDGEVSNGAEPIEWDVLGEKDGAYLLISHYVLDNRVFDDKQSDNTVGVDDDIVDTSATWEKCSLRKWLNDDFYNSAFSDTEKEYIMQVTNHTSDFTDFAGTEDATQYLFNVLDSTGGIGGNDTQDNVFLLSVEEFLTYYDMRTDVVNGPQYTALGAITSPTRYAMDEGIYYTSFKEAFYTNVEDSLYNTMNLEAEIGEDYVNSGVLCYWWLRSPGCYNDGSGEMISVAALWAFGTGHKEAACGVRPAIWIKY
jgi:hypothetical protein